MNCHPLLRVVRVFRGSTPKDSEETAEHAESAKRLRNHRRSSRLGDFAFNNSLITP